MMIYVFGDLRQLRSFELARVPDTDQPMPASFKLKHQVQSSRSPFRLFAKRPSTELSAEAKVGGIRPLTGPPPPLMHQSPSGDSTIAPHSPVDDSRSARSRPVPPRLQLDKPAPVHHYAHIQTSSRAYASHSQMQSTSTASTSYSVRFQNSESYPPYRMSFDLEDDRTVSGSEYESDYDTESDSDASSDGSHSTSTHEDAPAGAELSSPPRCTRRRRRRRRRREREPEIHISDAIFDEDPSPEGPAMGVQEPRRRSSVWGESSDEDVGMGMGATFIHAFRWDDADE